MAPTADAADSSAFEPTPADPGASTGSAPTTAKAPSPEAARARFALTLFERLEERIGLADRLRKAVSGEVGQEVFGLRDRLRQTDAVLKALNADLYAVGLDPEILALFANRCAALAATDKGVREAVAAAGSASLDGWLAERGYFPPSAVANLIGTSWNRGRDLLVILGAGSAQVADELVHLGQRRILTVDATAEETRVFDAGARPEIRNVHDLPALDAACRALPWPTPGRMRAVMVSPDCPVGLAPVTTRLNRTLQTMAEADFDIEDMWPFLAKTGVRNLPHLAGLPSVHVLRGALSGRTAVVVAAGPSLDSNIAELAQAAGRVAIIAVNRTVPALKRAGIRPDITVVLDPLDLRAQLEGHGPEDFGILLLGASVDSSLFGLPGYRVASFASSPVAEGWVYEILGEDAAVFCGGTVGTGAISLAVLLGCTTVVSIGRDLALTGGNYYAQNAGWGGHTVKVDQGANEIRFVSASDTLRVNEDGSDQEARALLVDQRYDLRQVRGHDGRPVLTTTLFEYELDVLCKTLVDIGPGVRFINATEGGAYIEGMEHLPLKAALAHCPSDSFDARVALARRLDGVAMSPRRRRLRDGCAEILDDIRRLTELSGRARSLSEQESPEGREAYQAVLAELAAASRKRLLFSTLVQRATRAIAQNDDAHNGRGWRSLEELRIREQGLFAAIDATLGNLGLAIESAIGQMDGQIAQRGESP